MNMEANNTTQIDNAELVLDASIDTSNTPPDLTLEAEAMPIEQWARKKRNRYLGQLRLLGTIHAEVSETINHSREAYWQLFFRPEDKYIPETTDKSLYVKLALGIQDATPIPSES